MDEFRNIWQSQEVDEVKMSIDELRARAGKFQRRIRRRNLIEQLAALYVVIVFGRGFMTATELVPRIAAALAIGGTIYVAWHLQKWGTPKSLPGEMGRTVCVGFYRGELERQRDLLRGVWKWYLGPLFPGLAVFTIYRIATSQPIGGMPPLLYAVTGILIFVQRVGSISGRRGGLKVGSRNWTARSRAEARAILRRCGVWPERRGLPALWYRL
jgi:hypothetical protein